MHFKSDMQDIKKNHCTRIEKSDNVGNCKKKDMVVKGKPFKSESKEKLFQPEHTRL